MQLFSMRVARINEQQTTAAGVMYTLHKGAHKYAAHNYSKTDSAEPCIISYTTVLNGTPRCSKGGAVDARLTDTDDGTNHFLPDGFNWDTMKNYFDSYVYKVGVGDTAFVITYMKPTDSVLGYNPAQIARQMKLLDYPISLHGTVVNDITCVGFKTSTVRSTAGGAKYTPCYTVPVGTGNGQIPVGSIGLISHF